MVAISAYSSSAFDALQRAPQPRPTAAPTDARTDGWLAGAQQAVQTLEAVKKGGDHSRQEADRQRLDQLRQQLRTLAMLGGDPKIRAKEAARIAKEIASLARDYDAAGGEPAPGAAASASQTGEAQAKDAQPQDGQTKDSQAKDAQPNDAQSANAPGSETSSAKADGAAASASALSSGSASDVSFIQMARGLLKLAKAIIEASHYKLGPNERDPLDDVREAARTLDGVAADLGVSTLADPAEPLVSIAV
jgi:hypothetical protein